MSKDYWVTVPVDAHVSVLVKDVDNEEEAQDKALEADFTIELHPDNREDTIELEQFELIRQVNTGNVCHITQWDIEAMEAF